MKNLIKAILIVAAGIFLFFTPIGISVICVLVIIALIWGTKATLDKNDKKKEEQLKRKVTTPLSEDSKMLNILLQGRECHCGRYEGNVAYSHIDEIKNAWLSVGVKLEYKETNHRGEILPSYKYFIDGEHIQRDEAWKHAMEFVGKHLEQKDWDW